MKKKQIKYCRLGLANVYSTHIEINENLKHNKKLRDYIIKHELEHKLNSFDLWHEFRINWKLMPSLFWFILTNPSTLIDFSPVQVKDKQIVYDTNLILLYAILIFTFFFSFKFFF